MLLYQSARYYYYKLVSRGVCPTKLILNVMVGSAVVIPPATIAFVVSSNIASAVQVYADTVKK